MIRSQRFFPPPELQQNKEDTDEKCELSVKSILASTFLPKAHNYHNPPLLKYFFGDVHLFLYVTPPSRNDTTGSPKTSEVFCQDFFHSTSLI
jgi:hypothetical protein